MNLQSLVNTKAALDAGLITEEDYEKVKETFLKAQQMRSAIDAGLIEERDVESMKGDFMKMMTNETRGSAVAEAAVNNTQRRRREGEGGGGGIVQVENVRQAEDRETGAGDSSKGRGNGGPPVPPPLPGCDGAAAAAGGAGQQTMKTKAAPPVAPPPMPTSNTTKSGGGGRAPVPSNIPGGKLGGAKGSVSGGTSMSGIVVTDDAVNVYYLVRSKSKYRWVTWKIHEEGTKVVIDAVGEPDSTYQDFLGVLPESDCRYCVFDYAFRDADGQAHSKIVFINWAPDVARAKAKMMYASTKDFFKTKLDGLSLEFQGSDMDEISEFEVGNAVRALKMR